MEIKSIPDLKQVAFIGNHLPRQCGIATFTTDLSDAFTEQFPDIQSMVLAMNDTIDGYTYDDKVRYEIRESKLFDLISSLIGVALVPLIITYLLEVYTSLRARNTLGLWGSKCISTLQKPVMLQRSSRRWAAAVGSIPAMWF